MSQTNDIKQLFQIVMLKKQKLTKTRSGLALSVFLLLMSLSVALTFSDYWEQWSWLLLGVMIVATLSSALYATQLDSYRNAKEDLFTKWLLLENEQQLLQLKQQLEQNRAITESERTLQKELFAEFESNKRKILKS